jgi:hypothetical protein
MVVKIKKKPVAKLSQEEKEEKFWGQVDQQSHYLVADTLNQVLPLPNLRDKKNLDLDWDEDYQTIFFACENNYSGENKIPSSEKLVGEIAYEYLLLVAKSILNRLSDFSCHDPAFFENLTGEN